MICFHRRKEWGKLKLNNFIWEFHCTRCNKVFKRVNWLESSEQEIQYPVDDLLGFDIESFYPSSLNLRNKEVTSSVDWIISRQKSDLAETLVTYEDEPYFFNLIRFQDKMRIVRYRAGYSIIIYHELFSPLNTELHEDELEFLNKLIPNMIERAKCYEMNYDFENDSCTFKASYIPLEDLIEYKVIRCNPYF